MDTVPASIRRFFGFSDAFEDKIRCQLHGGFQRTVVQQCPDAGTGEDIPGAVEGLGEFLVKVGEEAFLGGIVAHETDLTFGEADAGEDDLAGTKLGKLLEDVLNVRTVVPLFRIRNAQQMDGFREIGDDHIRPHTEALHMFREVLGKSVVEMPEITQNGIDKQAGLRPLEHPNNLPDDVDLCGRTEVAGVDGIEGDPLFFPLFGNGEHLFGQIAKAVVAECRVGGQHRSRQDDGFQSHGGQDWQGGSGGTFPHAGNVLDRQNSFHTFTSFLFIIIYFSGNVNPKGDFSGIAAKNLTNSSFPVIIKVESTLFMGYRGDAMLLKAVNIHKVYNGVPLLSDVNLQIEDQDRIGLIGANGCGKSTLLKILLGEVLPDHEREEDGVIIKGSKTSVGYLAQTAALDSSLTVWEEMRSVFAKLLAMQEKMRETELAMQNGSMELSEEYARMTAFFEANDGYQIDVKIKTVLHGMGFTEAEFHREVSGFSGGEKTRLAITKLLLESPNLLILDEPTNHLDFETIQWLEEYLQSYKGALLIVSHDRYFLDKLATSICEIEQGRLTRFKGNYSAYTVQKAAAVERQAKEYALQQREIAKLEDFVARNMARASTSKSAKSRQKQLDRMERIEKPVTPQKRAALQFSYEVEPPLDVLEVTDADISVGTGAERKTLLEQLSFTVRRGEKLGIVGVNGIGKSTLLKEILGTLPHQGRIRFNKNVRLAYFDQESTNLNPNNTVLDELHDRFPAMLDGEIRGILGQVRITGENVFKQISALSGGERARVCFALLMLEHANVMLLDEPTNHIDLPMKEVLEEALDAYTGTLLFVSHDRYFLKRLATQILELTPEGAVLHPYGFEQYLEEKAKRKAALVQEQAVQKPKPAAASHRSKAQRSADAARRARMRELEQEIEQLDETIAALEEQLTLPEICTDYQKMHAVCEELEAAKQRSEACFMELCELEEA